MLRKLVLTFFSDFTNGEENLIKNPQKFPDHPPLHDGFLV